MSIWPDSGLVFHTAINSSSPAAAAAEQIDRDQIDAPAFRAPVACARLSSSTQTHFRMIEDNPAVGWAEHGTDGDPDQPGV
jgi:hypothetical protein